MRIVSMKQIKTTLLAFLPSLFFIFSGCSNFGPNHTSSVRFSINASRAAISDTANTFVEVELLGDYSETKTVEFNAENTINISFNAVPVGASISARAQIYTSYEDDKLVLYSGKSETKIVTEEENILNIKLDIEYNSVVETSKSYIVYRPLFMVERDKRELTTNKLEFKNDDEEADETFCWPFEKLSDYQKAKVTFKGADLKAEEENLLAFKLTKTNTGAIYYQEQKPVTSEYTSYEFEIPQFIGLNSLGLENKWDTENGSWSGDFSCYIEKIELTKDPSVIPADFNVITKTASTCTIKNPAVQNIAYTNINRNKISFDSKQAFYDTQQEYSYSAAYWEFAELAQYDKVTIKFKRAASEDSENKLIIRGYTPYDYSIGQLSATSTIPESGGGGVVVEEEPYYHTLNDNDSKTVEIYLEELKTDLNIFTAISFQNNSFIENTDPEHLGEFDYGNMWMLEIEEIILEMLGAFDVQVTIAENQDIEVDQETITGGIRFTAPEGFTSYVWKLNGAEQTEVTGREFDVQTSSLPYGRSDVSLLVNDGTNYYSWQAQIFKPVN